MSILSEQKIKKKNPDDTLPTWRGKNEVYKIRDSPLPVITNTFVVAFSLSVEHSEHVDTKLAVVEPTVAVTFLETK